MINKKLWARSLSFVTAGELVTLDSEAILIVALWEGWGDWSERYSYFNQIKATDVNSAIEFLKGKFK